VDLDLSDDQEALRSALRDFFEKEAPTEVVRAAEPLGFDAALWRKVVGLGLGAIAVPEERGGGGAGFVELAIAAEILGRTLAPVPLIEAAVATTPGPTPTWRRSGPTSSAAAAATRPRSSTPGSPATASSPRGGHRSTAGATSTRASPGRSSTSAPAAASTSTGGRRRAW
jgi:alkylation response protein AidB-like acyl-CoA dehydrogenase